MLPILLMVSLFVMSTATSHQSAIMLALLGVAMYTVPTMMAQSASSPLLSSSSCIAADMYAAVPNNRMSLAAVTRGGSIDVRNLVAYHQIDLKAVEGSIYAEFALGAANFTFSSAIGSMYGRKEGGGVGLIRQTLLLTHATAGTER